MELLNDSREGNYIIQHEWARKVNGGEEGCTSVVGVEVHENERMKKSVKRFDSKLEEVGPDMPSSVGNLHFHRGPLWMRELAVVVPVSLVCAVEDLKAKKVGACRKRLSAPPEAQFRSLCRNVDRCAVRQLCL